MFIKSIAKVPLFLVSLVLIPIARNLLVHFVGDMVNEFLTLSDNRGSKIFAFRIIVHLKGEIVPIVIIKLCRTKSKNCVD